VIREISSVATELSGALAFLDPVANRFTRLIALETVQADWIAVYTNWDTGWFQLGQSVSKELRTDVCVFRAIPDTLRRDSKGQLIGRPGAATFALFSKGNTVRSLTCLNDNGRWRFTQEGKPLAFERRAQYRAKNLRDRFTIAMLLEYMAALRLRPFEDDFFAVGTQRPARGMEVLPADPDSVRGIRFTPMRILRRQWALTNKLLDENFRTFSSRDVAEL
jgi:hypothetical protein